MTLPRRFDHRPVAALAVAIALVLVLPLAAQAAEENGETDGADETPGWLTNPADEWSLAPPDTSRWRCRNCPYDWGWSGFAELGGGYVSDDSFEFGDYRGLEEEGGYGIAGADVLYRAESGTYLDMRGSELGLDSRQARISGGRQGLFDLTLAYDEIPHFVAGDTRTIHRGVGTNDLVLPGGWVRANNTSGMAQLDASLRDTVIGTQRETGSIGLDFTPGDRWHYSLDYSESTKEGTRIQGGSFLFRSALLPAPVDYETERLDASAAYIRETWQVELAYHASVFRNENDALVWDNPFTSGNGADRGRLALAPDNEFNQVMVSGSWRSRNSLVVSGRLAAGRMQQDEAFLASTINGNLNAPAAPRNDLDGEVDTRNADLRIVGEPSQRLTAKAELRYAERDNQTPRDTYTQVVTDEFVGNSEVNTPYSYEKIGADTTLDYRVSRGFTLAGSAGREEVDRSFQDVEQTQTDTLWIEARGRPTERLHMRLRQTREERDGAYEPFQPVATQSPELRRYHVAERDREATRISFDYLAGGSVSVGGAFELAEDDYTDSDVGLSNARERSVTLSLSGMPAEGVTAHGFVSAQILDSSVRGRDNATGAPWVADISDAFTTFGVGARVNDLPWGFEDGSIELTVGRSNGSIDLQKTGATTEPLPGLGTDLHTLDVSASRPLGQDLDLRVGYLFEGFSEEDFQHDDVDPGTIPTVVTLGQGTPGYDVHVIQLALRYRF